MALSNMYGHSTVLIDADYHRIGAHLIQPFTPGQVQPASYDVTLAPRILRTRTFDAPPTLDLSLDDPCALMEADEIGPQGYILRSRECALVATAEQIRCPTDMTCAVDGKSTIGRCFLAIHSTAGFVDPGYCGAITLELMNHAPWDFVLRAGMRIGQLRFFWLGKEVDRAYGTPGLGSHYQGSVEVRAAESTRSGK
jgi:dCTP deaminase